MIERNRIHSVLVVILLLAISIGCQQPDATSGSDASAPSASDSDSALSQVVPKPVVTDVPAGTKVHIELLETLASNRNQAGDRVSGRVARDVVVAGSVAIPAGSEVSGLVTEAVGLKKIGGRARLGLKFTSVEPPSGSQSAIQASYLAVGKSETKKDAATIAGSAAGGAILGRILGHQKDKDARGTAIGGVVGAGVRTAVAAQTGRVLPAQYPRHWSLTLCLAAMTCFITRLGAPMPAFRGSLSRKDPAFSIPKWRTDSGRRGGR